MNVWTIVGAVIFTVCVSSFVIMIIDRILSARVQSQRIRICIGLASIVIPISLAYIVNKNGFKDTVITSKTDYDVIKETQGSNNLTTTEHYSESSETSQGDLSDYILYNSNDNESQGIILHGWAEGDENYGTLYSFGEKEYEGDLKDGKPHGKGIAYYTELDLIPYFANEAIVEIRARYDTGDDWIKYEGDFVNGKYEGNGTLYYADGNKYEGEFVNGKYEGYGTYYWADGNWLECEYKDGKRNGYGTFYFANGERYEGEFKDDERNGNGTYYRANGDWYEGEYKDGKMNIDKYCWANGDWYEGEFYGQGIMHLQSGSSFAVYTYDDGNGSWHWERK